MVMDYGDDELMAVYQSEPSSLDSELEFLSAKDDSLDSNSWRGAFPDANELPLELSSRVPNAERKVTKKSSSQSSDFSNHNYFKNLNNHPLLSKQEEVDFATLRNSGSRKAVNQLVVSNLRLVVKFAKKFKNRGIDFDDLIQEGNMGLIRAAELYNPKKGTRFSTYASMWIMQSLSRAVDKYSRTVKLPASMQLDIRAIYRCLDVHRIVSGKELTPEEIAKLTNLSIERVNDAMIYVATSVSLNKKLFDDGGSELGDTIAQYSDEDMEKVTERHFQTQEIESLMSCLSDEERFVIVHRFGLFDAEIMSFESLAQLTDSDVNDVRNAQRRALKRMKRLNAATKLKAKNAKKPDKIGKYAY